MKERAKAGDVFVCELDNGSFMFGRVLMDVKAQCFDSGILPKKEETNLRHYSTGYVIEIYDAVTDSDSIPETLTIKIPGIAVDEDAFENNDWRVIGFNEPSPEELDFQESINFYDGEIDFHRGEIYKSYDVPAGLMSDELEELEASAFVNSVLIFDDTYDFIESGDRTELLDYDKRLLSKEVRDSIYKVIGEDPGISYFELAKKHGFDSSRFYK